MRRIAVLGASGFIGNRTVEVFQRGGDVDVCPVVQRPSRAALPRRFDLPVQIANALDTNSLTAAFRGCDNVIMAIAGDPKTIVRSMEPVYRAAMRSNVRRLIYLSSASVYGQSPATGVDETTPLSKRQPLAYNSAKVVAEQQLGRLRQIGRVEVVILRPGIVFGPRSQWTGGVADEILKGTAYLTEGGWGVCNSIYVDNLVYAIKLALVAPNVDGKAFLLGDAEAVTWRDLYLPICEALGYDLDGLPTPKMADAVDERPSLAQRVRAMNSYQSLRWIVPRPARAAVKAAIREMRRPPSTENAASYSVTLERALLHTSSYRPPYARAERELGYCPPITFEEGCRRSVEWLGFAGYPVDGRSRHA
ncbi:NAD-dependent epimerase/dehydratase family protein [Bradyrhizobium sp. LLZ17]|uniref:NAD-dependent epimerase/dehydratase family protein n=1 Tax=Bradyrhizobium sp. LLZ17 TaxID=3239388 RepID=A0AB39XU19_9BRAD